MLEFHNLADLFPLLEGDEFQVFKTDIANNGQHEPIRLYEGKILDGRNRYRACLELGVSPAIVEWQGGYTEAARYVISANLHRRHLTSSQRAGIAAKAEEVLARLEAEGRERKLSGKGSDGSGGRGNVKNLVEIIPQGFERAPPTRDLAARLFQTNGKYIDVAKQLRAEAPDLLEHVIEGKVSIPKAARKLKKRTQASQRKNFPQQYASETIEKMLNDCIILGDFSQVMAEMAPNTIDVIITDPPYKDFQLYGDLARQASYVLKPGGSLLAMSGQYHINKIYPLMDKHLTYLWTLSYLTPGGQSAQIWPRKVNTFWKPILWYTKSGGLERSWQGDVIRSDVNDNDKRFHEWGQSESGFTRLVEKFSEPGDLILDPFFGGGTTGIVALRLGRRFIGIDNDDSVIRIARERLYNELHKEQEQTRRSGADGVERLTPEPAP